MNPNSQMVRPSGWQTVRETMDGYYKSYEHRTITHGPGEESMYRSEETLHPFTESQSLFGPRARTARGVMNESSGRREDT